MNIAKIQFAPWDKVYDFKIPHSLENLKKSDCVIVETELGKELGKIVSLSKKDANSLDLKPVIKKADFDDVASYKNNERKDEVLSYCREMIDKHGLKMKLVDVHFSYSGNRINLAFTSEGRVDFRDLVKDLAGRFSASIRLTQIGTRDEARLSGDCGPCGRSLCCKQFINDFCSITSEMAEVQQVVHRGSDRISGMCGRLMCCLAYEFEGYKELSKELPPVGTKVNVDGSKGQIISHNTLKQTVNVKLKPSREEDRPVIVEIDPNRKKKQEQESKENISKKANNLINNIN
nr:regulatory iron-sulfur-containing complex subunit RicT [Patescibacteria group bacterium]